jgi:aminotransferase
MTTKISDRVLAMNPPPIKEVSALIESIPGVVSLGQGTPSFRTPLHIRGAVQRALDRKAAVDKYVVYSGRPDLKRAVAAKLTTETKIRFDPEKEIIVTVGASEAAAAVLLTLIGPGDEVILPVPTYPPYFNAINLADGRARPIPCRSDEGWRLNLEAIKKAINDKTKLIMFCHPANPTGAVYPKEDLTALAQLARDHDLFILADETYRFLVYDDRPFFSLARIRELKENLFLVRTFSKEYAMTGWRVGFLVAPLKIVPQILKVHETLVGCAPSISQEAALTALRGPQACVKEFREAFSKRRRLICSRLDRLESVFSYHPPQGAYYVWVKVVAESLPSSRQLTRRLIREAKVAVIPGAAFGPDDDYDQYLRLSFSAEAGKINQAFDRIEAWLEKQKTRDGNCVPKRGRGVFPGAPGSNASRRKPGCFPQRAQPSSSRE